MSVRTRVTKATRHHVPRLSGCWTRRCAVVPLLACTLAAWAAQIDIPGPAGSGEFGYGVTALPNGNFVVVDPFGPVSNVGAVYLYGPDGALINYFTGSSTNDVVGIGGVVVVGNSNFAVLSPNWNNGSATWAGAVTWVDGNVGRTGVVSASNSLVGTATDDEIGASVTVLTNGSFVVASGNWNGGRGAATLIDGNAGLTGNVTAQNSLTGSAQGDSVGSNGVTALRYGNYVVKSPYWNSGYGAATWASGTTGRKVVVTASNSLVGGGLNDRVGLYVTALSNGNYVVRSPYFNGDRGAATWGDGRSGTIGTVGPVNSLVGVDAGVQVGMGGVVALTNGNYVVATSQWYGARGAATLGSGTSGVVGFPSPSNSLTGAAPNDRVGVSVTALTNGNYVVSSPAWNGNRGAFTWVDGNAGLTDTVSVANSVVGTTTGDAVGTTVTPLSNGNYVVTSTSWNNTAGAATWGSGIAPSSGIVSGLNSLVGSAAADYTGYAIAALSNGNYVVTSYGWNANRGAATWANGATGLSGAVSAANSLIGGVGSHVGGGVVAVDNGNYVVLSPAWNNAAGALTWGRGKSGLTGVVTATNSFVGTVPGDQVGGSVAAMSDGAYVARFLNWGSTTGAITLASGAFRLTGTVQHWNSVEGSGSSSSSGMTYSYDALQHRLIVGRPHDNVASIFTSDQPFADGFE